MFVSLASHTLALIGFSGFAAVLWIGGNRHGPTVLLIIACISTALWAAAVLLGDLEGEVRGWPTLILETARTASWIGFLFRLMADSAARRETRIPLRYVVPGGLLFASIIAADLAHDLDPDILPAGTLDMYSLIGRVLIPIIGLTLIENLVRNDWGAAGWWARFLFVGLGGIFAYDLFLYSEALLFRRVNLDLYAVRGAVDVIAVPLLAISFARNPTFAVNIHVSRGFVFHTMTFAGTGVFLLLMAVAGVYLANFGGSWGTFLEVMFVSAALAMVLLTLSSGTFRSLVRNFVNANFFSYKYDYRHEWRQFIGLISAQESLLPLHDRVVQAIANIVDSPAGALWVLRDDSYVNTVAWNTPRARDVHPADRPSLESAEALRTIVDLQALPVPGGAPRTTAPDWLRALPRAWIIVPLIHRHRALGFLVLARPRAPRLLDQEDYDLLSTAADQAASYIAEEETARALMDARQLEIFNQRFAFVVHDIKNLVSQLSLILSNVERHGDNPEFQRDVVTTVRHSVARMKSLLEQISITKRAPAEAEPVDVVALLRRDWADRSLYPQLRLLLPDAPCFIRGDAETLSRVLRHIVQNAIEAIAADGRVELRLAAEADFAQLKVIDNGVGMTPEFIRDTLFRPFGSTKKSGYGIGAYQARELIRGMGGRLEVASTPGSGTEVTISLPLSTEGAARARQVQEA